MIAAASVVLLGLGVLTAFFGLTTAGAAASAFVEGVPGPTAIFVGLGGAVLVIGMLGVTAGIGLLAGRRWAPALAIVIAALEVAAGLGAFLVAALQPDAFVRGNATSLVGPVVLIALASFVAWAVIWQRATARR